MTDTAPAKPRTLMDLSNDFIALDDMLAETGGDISDPRVAEIIDKWMNELEVGLESKVDNYAAYITELLRRAEARDAEAKRMAERARIDKNAADALKERLKFVFENVLHIKKLETPRFRVSVVANGGRQPVEILDEKAVPEQYMDYNPTINKSRIADDLAAGKELAFARLGERGTHIRIG